MKKRIVSISLALLLLLTVLPFQAFAAETDDAAAVGEDTRTTISKLELASDIADVAVYGGEIRWPSFTVTNGAPIRIPESMGHWSRRNGDKWETFYGGSFSAGTWKFSMQVRIDNDEGKQYKLAEQTTLSVNGTPWTTSTKSVVMDTYSYTNATSPEFVIPEGSELIFLQSSSISEIPASYVNKPITPLDVSPYVSGGAKPYTFSKTDGPGWISVSKGGVISGTPTAADGNTHHLTVRVTDSKGAYREIELLVGVTVLADEDKQTVSYVEATSDIRQIAVIGGAIKDPTFTVTNGAPVRFPASMGDWYRQNGDKWERVESGVFTEGTWRFGIQMRVDGEDGAYAKLADFPVVKIDGVTWTNSTSASIVMPTYSFTNITMPAFTLESEKYELWLAGNQVSMENIDRLAELVAPLNNEAMERYMNGEMDITYDVDTKTLTLQNAIIDTDTLEARGATFGVDGLTVVLKGDNHIYGRAYSGLKITRDVTITGSGSLTVFGETSGVMYNAATDAGAKVTVQNTTLSVESRFAFLGETSRPSALEVINSDVTMDTTQQAVIYLSSLALKDCSFTEPQTYAFSSGSINDGSEQPSKRVRISPDGVIWGDVNGDGVVDISDATMIQMYSASLTTLSEAQIHCGDVNGDGLVDITDATYIQMYAASLIPSLNPADLKSK